MEVKEKRHVTSNKQLHVGYLTSLNFVPWPYGTETNGASIVVLHFEIFHEIFQRKK